MFKKLLRLCWWSVSAVISLGIVLIALLGWDFLQFIEQPLSVPQEAILHVNRGATVKSLSRQLQKQGWINRAEYFHALSVWKHKTAIKQGEYSIPQGIRAEALLDILLLGQVIEYKLTLIEGWNFSQVMQAVRASPHLQHTLTSLNAEQIMAKLGYHGIHPEGRFFPDTYQFARNTTDVEFLQRAFETLQKVLAQEWQNRAKNLPLENEDEALILASIIEKETGSAKERDKIAGVFIRRLQKKMRLQSDPTVIYGLRERYQGNIQRTHLREKNAWNTYIIPALPITPIAMPGRAAIHACLHPASGKSLYFVATGEGGHFFSANLKEHNRAVRKYQLK